VTSGGLYRRYYHFGPAFPAVDDIDTGGGVRWGFELELGATDSALLNADTARECSSREGEMGF
jgi:hypothetical protein